MKVKPERGEREKDILVKAESSKLQVFEQSLLPTHSIACRLPLTVSFWIVSPCSSSSYQAPQASTCPDTQIRPRSCCLSFPLDSSPSLFHSIPIVASKQELPG